MAAEEEQGERVVLGGRPAPQLGGAFPGRWGDERVRRGRTRTACGRRVVTGPAPSSLSELDVPDAVFIGGGLTAPGLLDACWEALRPGGRLVANTVTLESEALLGEWYRAYGGELTRLAVAHAVPVGGFTGWRQAMPVTQWSVRKSPSPSPSAVPSPARVPVPGDRT
ncbi:hypothetical protein SMICM304S_02095 [Streptomyces microflavus]